ncbi:MAG: zinc ribbon domain-containing protein [Candidatus Zixiibacteriota bacterium]
MQTVRGREEVFVNHDLELLLKLQVIDYDLGELERSKEYLPDMMDNLHREIRESKENLETAASEHEQAHVLQKNLELEIATKNEELQKFQQQMMSIKTNKEYDALVAEIDAAKAFVSDKETELLETIDRIGELDKMIEEYRARENQTRENNDRQLQILQEKVDSIGDKVSGKQTDRKTTLSEIPKRTLSIYERVRRGKGGTAVVAVKKRACGSCYKALTPRKVQEVRAGEKIQTCDNCGRLMYWNDGESD